MYGLSEVVDLLSRLVSYNTVNDPANNIRPSREIVDYICSWLRGNDIECSVIENNGYYSVFGVLGKDPKVLLLAHFDTVPVIRERWKTDPFKLTIIGDKGYGRGALDDKSNVAAIMVALKKFREKGLSVVYAFTGDEEIGGTNGARVIAEKIVGEKYDIKYLINGDGAGMKIIVRRRKAFKVVVSTKSVKEIVYGEVGEKVFEPYYPVKQHSHAAYFIPGVDAHPLLMASIFIRENNLYVESLGGEFVKSNVIPSSVQIRYVKQSSKGSSVEVDLGLTGLLKYLSTLSRTPIETRGFSEYGVSITPNMYEYRAGKHVVVFDVRAMAGREDVEKAFRKTVEEIPLDIEIDVKTGIGGYMNTSPKSPLVKALEEALRENGYTPELSEGAGASDSRYFVTHGIEAIDLGPRGEGMHGDNEYIYIPDLVKLPQIYVEAVEKLYSLIK